MLACLALCLQGISSSVKAEEANSVSDWYYTYRPNDALPDVAKRLLQAKYQWTDLVRYNRIQDVNKVQAGSIIKIPIDWLKSQPKPAKVLSIDGVVLIKSARGARFIPLKANQAIQVGDELITRDGTALIKLADNSIIRIEADSQVHFNRMSHYGETGMVDTRIRLKKGSMVNNVVPLERGSRFEVSTPSAVAAVRGTEFRISTDGNNSQVEVTEGRVEFIHAHGSQLIEAGQGAKINRQQATARVKALLPPPERQFNDETITSLPAKLNWQQQAAADRYKYEIRSVESPGTVYERANSDKPEVQLTQLKNGDYSVTMQAIDKEGFEGQKDQSALSVEVPGAVATLLAPQNQTMTELDGLVFRWELGDDTAKSRLELSSDQSFTKDLIQQDYALRNRFDEALRLSPGVYHWRVSTLTRNNIEDQSETRTLKVRGKMPEVSILSVNYVKNQVGLFWNGVDEAESYVLQVSGDESFATILREERLEKTSAFLKLSQDKTYFARVKALGGELYRSEFGPSTRLQLGDE